MPKKIPTPTMQKPSRPKPFHSPLIIPKLFRGIKIPKVVAIGIIGVVFMYVGVAGLISTSAPWLVRGDTRQQVDYVWQVYNHKLPNFSEGIKYPPFIKIYGFKKQGVAANPPLFYLLQAPIIGPLLKQGRWQGAIALGRAINIFFGVLCIFVLSWAGWIFGGKRGEVFAVAVPALSVLIFRFTRLNVDYAIDALLVTLSTLSLIYNYKILRYGLRSKYLIAIAIISVLGMATKAPYIVFLMTSLLAIMLASIIHGSKKMSKDILRGMLLAAIVFAIVVITIGWYYYFRNFKTNGKWFSASPNTYTGGRTYKSLSDVITSKKLWELGYANFALSQTASIAILIFSIAGVFSITKERLIAFTKDKARLIAYLLMALTLLGVFLTQIVFAIGYGSINFRYILPALLPIGLFLSFGLLQFRWIRGQLVSLTAIIMGGLTLRSLGGIRSAAAANNIWTGVPLILLGIFAVGAAILSASLFILTGKNKV